jgi:predicted alpha/beta-fold hydrolase
MGIILITRPERPALLACLFLALVVISPWSLDDPEEIHNINPGLYYNPQTELVDRMVQNWDIPQYSKIATPWQWTGDARTGFPYLMNNLKNHPKFHRVWQPTVDGEYVALDIAFPKTGHDSSQPLYLILHGLNGGSEEGYVLDFTASRIEKGSTVVVLVARGLMDTPIQGWTVSEETF